MAHAAPRLSELNPENQSMLDSCLLQYEHIGYHARSFVLWTHQSRIPQSRGRIYIVAVDQAVPHSKNIINAAADFIARMTGDAHAAGCRGLDSFLLPEAGLATVLSYRTVAN